MGQRHEGIAQGQSGGERSQRNFFCGALGERQQGGVEITGRAGPGAGAAPPACGLGQAQKPGRTFQIGGQSQGMGIGAVYLRQDVAGHSLRPCQLNQVATRRRSRPELRSRTG